MKQQFLLLRVSGGKKSKKRPEPKKKKAGKIKNEFAVALSSVYEKKIKDDNSAYYIIEFHSKPLSEKYMRILNRLDVDLIVAIDRSLKKFVVRSGYNIHPQGENEVRDIIKEVRAFRTLDIIQQDLINNQTSFAIVLNLFQICITYFSAH